MTPLQGKDATLKITPKLMPAAGAGQSIEILSLHSGEDIDINCRARLNSLILSEMQAQHRSRCACRFDRSNFLTIFL
jgi:hypothetical protein